MQWFETGEHDRVERVAAGLREPRRLRDYADFLDFLIGRHGAHFEHVELWNEPSNVAEWDRRLDLEWNAFAEMIATPRTGAAAAASGRCSAE